MLAVMRGAGPTILMCDDQENEARACPQYAPGPSWPAVSLRPIRSRVGPHRPVAARSAPARPAAIHARRVIVNAILYVNRTGCAWRYLPKDFPPWRTVYGYFAAWRDNGTLQRLHDRLRDQARIAAGRDPQPTAAVMDSQSVKAADTVPKASRGWDNAKR